MAIRPDRLGHDGLLEKAAFGGFSRGIDSDTRGEAPTFEWIEEPLDDVRGTQLGSDIVLLELIVALDRAGRMEGQAFSSALRDRADKLKAQFPPGASFMRRRMISSIEQFIRAIDEARRQQDAKG